MQRKQGGGRKGERDRQNATCFGDSLNPLYKSSPARLPLANHLAFSGLEPTFGLTQGPPHYACSSFSQDGSSARVSGKLTGCTKIWCLLSSLIPEESFCPCVAQEVSLTSRMKNTWLLYILSKKDSAPPCSCHNVYLGVSVQRGQIPIAQPRNYLLLQKDHPSQFFPLIFIHTLSSMTILFFSLTIHQLQCLYK